MKKAIIILTLIVFTVIIFAPPIIHGYVYPVRGDDSGNHLNYIKGVSEGKNPLYTYVGQLILAKVLIGINDFTGIGINSMFLWLNFLTLWLVGIVVYLISGIVIGWISGLVTIPIMLFVQPSVLNLYDDGSIFDLFTVAILTPLMVFMLAKIWGAKKLTKIICISVFTVVVSLVIALHSSAIFRYGFGSDNVVLPTANYFIFLLGFWMLGIIILLVINHAIIWRSLSLTLKVMFLILGLIIVGLSIVSFTHLTIIPMRFAVDLAIIVTAVVALASAIFMKYGKSKLVKYGIVGLIVIASVPNVINYFGYNSAVKPIDKEVIAYINTLPGDYYSCSEDVAPWVYSPFVNKDYKEGVLPFITRNKPMTPNSTKGTKFNWRLGYGDIEAIGTDKQVFEDEDIVIEVFYK